MFLDNLLHVKGKLFQNKSGNSIEWNKEILHKNRVISLFIQFYKLIFIKNIENSLHFHISYIFFHNVLLAMILMLYYPFERDLNVAMLLLYFISYLNYWMNYVHSIVIELFCVWKRINKHNLLFSHNLYKVIAIPIGVDRLQITAETHFICQCKEIECSFDFMK